MHVRWMKVTAGCLLLLTVGGLIFSSSRLQVWYSKPLERWEIVTSAVATTVATSQLTGPGCTNERRKAERPGGFMLAYRFWEQQTQAMKSVLQLQCLASNHGMRTVEPFLYRSFLGFPFSEMLSNKSHLRMGDLVDIDLWNRESVGRFGFFPVASWQEFVMSAPRDVIIVCVKYRDPPHIRVPPPGADYKTGCAKECYHNFNSSLSVLKRYGDFRIVREVCANFVVYAGSVSEGDFITNILGKYDHQSVTVLMNEFRGFYGLYRMQVLSNCGVDYYKPNITILPSVSILSDAAGYISDVLDDEPYIAILVRIERAVLHLHYDIADCTNQLKDLLQTLSQQYSTKKYFLAMDVGKFGSSGSIVHNLTSHGDTVLSAVYGNSLTFSDWEKEFERHASQVEEAYVANLQRAIAAQSRCLVMFGGGGFQAQARAFYRKHHQDAREWCVFRVCDDTNFAPSGHPP